MRSSVTPRLLVCWSVLLGGLSASCTDGTPPDAAAPPGDASGADASAARETPLPDGGAGDAGSPLAPDASSHDAGPTPADAARDAANDGPTSVPPLPDSGLSDALTVFVASISPGAWKAVPSSKMHGVAYGSAPGDDAALASAIAENDGPAGIMGAWGGATWDSTNHQLLVWGGGHVDYWGNEVYAFQAPTLTWARLTKPSDPNGFDPFTSASMPSDGRPIPHHTYDTLVWLPGQSLMWTITYPTFGLTFDPRAQSVTSPGNFTMKAKWPGNSSIGGSTEMISHYDPVSGHVFTVQPGIYGMYEYDPAADTFTLRGGDPPGDDYHQSGALEPGVRLIGMGNGRLFSYALTSPWACTFPVATTGPSPLDAQGNIGSAWYPGAHKFVAWVGGQTLYTLDPATTPWTWTAEAMSGGDTPDDAQPNGTYGRFQWLEEYGVFLVVSSIDSQVYVGRPDF